MYVSSKPIHPSLVDTQLILGLGRFVSLDCEFVSHRISVGVFRQTHSNQTKYGGVAKQVKHRAKTQFCQSQLGFRATHGPACSEC
mmetsp:Transcript_58/g.117  ORF Transcript_58/g.117 Transcript_58/m.117 type:complete len:85 (-) Transcript_58:2315-2569(-)